MVTDRYATALAAGRHPAAAAGLLRDVPVAVTDDDSLGIDTNVAAVAVTEGMTATEIGRAHV